MCPTVLFNICALQPGSLNKSFVDYTIQPILAQMLEP